ncbi:MAG: Hsp20/alpha crystallin family protein [Pseudomonadota bacterium]
MHEDVDRLFEDFLPQFSDSGELESRMKGLAQIDLSKTDDVLKIDVDLTVVKEDDIDVTFRDGVLFITGERKHESEEKLRSA